jgi:hypothetical protein
MLKAKPIWSRAKLSLKHLGIFVLCFGVIGGYIIWRGFAATPANVDINQDGAVNITDLSLLLSSYGQNITQCATNNTYKCDLSSPSDGVVNVFDLSILLSYR